MFFHGIAYRTFVENIFKNYKMEELEDGDVFVSNHPYEAGMPHVSDMGFVAPIYAEGKLIGFSASIAHKADIGGTNPGSTSANSTEMYHEGLLLPPIKYYRAGEPDEDIERVILGNSRQPDLVRGDIHAQVAATIMGVKRLKEISQRFSADTVIGSFDAILDGAADELRKAIATLPDGTSSAVGFMDDDGIDRDTPVKFAVTITIDGDKAIFDYSDSGPQARGPVNLRPAMVEACTFYCLVGALGPYDLHYNGGMGDVVDMKFAPNTVTNASPPAPVSSYQKANLRLVDVILDAMSKFTPTRAIAGSGSSGSLLIAWQGGGRAGHSNMQYEILGSAYGGGHGHDGCSATATHLSNLHITPIEILESEYPCRVTEMSMIPDSGGAGEFRGGTVFRRRYELLQDAIVVRRYEKAKFPAGGVDGGSDGRRSQFVKIGGNGAETPLEAAGRFEMKAGEGFYLDKAGGGGFGDPKKRDPDSIKRDIAEGYVTEEGAKRDYDFDG
jgi:N-methylhydantoinase B